MSSELVEALQSVPFDRLRAHARQAQGAYRQAQGTRFQRPRGTCSNRLRAASSAATI